MIFKCVDDFYAYASMIKPLSREQERALALAMREGNAQAREAIIRGYMPFISAKMKGLSKQESSLELLYRMISKLEELVDKFDFLQEGETFIHRLSMALRHTVVEYIADK